NFAHQFSESLASSELPYDASAWTALEKKLSSKRKSNFLKWGFGGGAVLLLMIGIASLMRYNNRAEDSKTNLPLIENNSSETKNETKTDIKTNLTENTISEKTVLNLPEETIQPEKIEGNNNHLNASNITVTPTDYSPVNVKNTNESETFENKSMISKEEETYKIQLPSFPSKCQGDKFEIMNKIGHTLVLVLPSGKKITANEGETLSQTLHENGNYKVYYADKSQSTHILEEKSFVVNKSPLLELQLADALDYETGLPVLHCECSTNESNVNWYLNNKTCTSTSDFKNDLVMFDKGRNTIELSVKNEIGCEAKTSRIFQVQEDYNLLAVNSFSPSSHDVRKINFMPYALTIRNIPFVLTILDPDNGGTVFTSTDASQPWDGIDRRTGNLVPLDKAYIWRVVLSSPNKGEKSIYKGTIVRF
ncbi:MAG: hypothetical protein ACKO1R_10400, partial [Crocinitomicaceae bacterium]